VAARAGVALVAVAVLIWLGIMERDAFLQGRGVDIAGGTVLTGRTSPESFRAAEADFKGARLLNPDTQPDLHLAVLYEVHGRAREATALVEDVVRREPENLSAWGLLYSLAHDRDPATARRALAARKRLNPVAVRTR
jgi:hypothetical protein